MRTFFGLSFRCRAAVLTTGTFMNGRIWVGRMSMPAGRSACLLASPSIVRHGQDVLTVKRSPLLPASHDPHMLHCSSCLMPSILF